MSTTITRQDIPSLSIYRQGREAYVNKMIQYKKDRRVKLGDHISVLFENKQTVLFQILELIHNEDLTDEREIEEYVEIYSPMLPGDDELSATLFVESDNQTELTRLLIELKGIEQHLTLYVGGEAIRAVFEEEHDDREFTTSVHYLKFPLTGTAKAYIANGSTEHEELRLVLDHPNLHAETTLSAETVAALARDLG
jgi:hypothetical protein